VWLWPPCQGRGDLRARHQVPPNSFVSEPLSTEDKEREPAPVVPGVPGSSARREYELRKAASDFTGQLGSRALTEDAAYSTLSTTNWFAMSADKPTGTSGFMSIELTGCTRRSTGNVTGSPEAGAWLRTTCGKSSRPTPLSG